MPCFICTTCGTQHAERDMPPERCRICTDDRQYVGRDGQHWTTHDELLAGLHLRMEHDAELLGIGVLEPFGIPQRALVVPTSSGNVLWDCVSLVTPEAVDALAALGGVDAIAISHPHFYSSMVEWSRALGDVPILVHEADASWIERTSGAVQHWRGSELVLGPDSRLVHCPGHFPGSSVLHWSPAGRGGVLLAGDSLHVAADRRHVSVMHSVPNHVPVGVSIVRDVRARLADLDFDDLYGFTWGLNILGGARGAVDESLERYLRAIAA